MLCVRVSTNDSSVVHDVAIWQWAFIPGTDTNNIQVRVSFSPEIMLNDFTFLKESLA